MKTTIKILIILALALATFGQHSSASAGSNYKFRGDTADAYFSSFDGCVYTDVYVFASDGISQSPPGRGGTSSGTSVSIYKFDSCSETQLLAADGFVSLAASAFQVSSKLGSAKLSATVPVYDYVSGLNLNVSVNLTWTGSGSISRQSYRSQYNSPGCKTHSSFSGTWRSAEVSGSVSDGTTNYTPVPFGGSIASVKQGDLFIGCN
jgi:hypothetical protein